MQHLKEEFSELQESSRLECEHEARSYFVEGQGLGKFAQKVSVQNYLLFPLKNEIHTEKENTEIIDYSRRCKQPV